MTASGLSLVVMSGFKTVQNPDCNQNKGWQKDEKKDWLSQQEQAACDPLSAGWLVLKQQDLLWGQGGGRVVVVVVGGSIVTPRQPAGQPLQTRPGFLILITCTGSDSYGEHHMLRIMTRHLKQNTLGADPHKKRGKKKDAGTRNCKGRGVT